MPSLDTAIAAFGDHQGAEIAVKKLTQAGLDMKILRIVGKGFHMEETAIKADGFPVMAHGSADEVAGAKSIMATAIAVRTEVHTIAGKTPPVASQLPVGA
jgi:hypothetical protein